MSRRQVRAQFTPPSQGAKRLFCEPSCVTSPIGAGRGAATVHLPTHTASSAKSVYLHAFCVFVCICAEQPCLFLTSVLKCVFPTLGAGTKEGGNDYFSTGNGKRVMHTQAHTDSTDANFPINGNTLYLTLTSSQMDCFNQTLSSWKI